MLVLCKYEAEGFELIPSPGNQPSRRSSRLSRFTGGIMISVRSDKEIRHAFQAEMRAQLENWRGPILPHTWELKSYLPECGSPRFGKGVESTTGMPPPMAEHGLGAMIEPIQLSADSQAPKYIRIDSSDYQLTKTVYPDETKH